MLCINSNKEVKFREGCDLIMIDTYQGLSSPVTPPSVCAHVWGGDLVKKLISGPERKKTANSSWEDTPASTLCSVEI